MKLQRLLVAIGLTLAISAPIAAQTPDPEATIVQELVVTARAGGPAWWRVSSGPSTVYVLGVPEALPKGLRWDMTLTRRRLAGAHELIEPPVVTAGLGDLFGLDAPGGGPADGVGLPPPRRPPGARAGRRCHPLGAQPGRERRAGEQNPRGVAGPGGGERSGAVGSRLHGRCSGRDRGRRWPGQVGGRRLGSRRRGRRPRRSAGLREVSGQPARRRRRRH